jgi:hypothetical protein
VGGSVPEVVTTLLDAVALLGVAVGLGLLAGAAVFGWLGRAHPDWYGFGAGLLVAGLVLFTGSWWATRRAPP